jgi:hypothetical protein
VAGLLVALIAAAVMGLVAGRVTAPGPDIVVAAAPIVEQAPDVAPVPVGNSRPQEVAATPSAVAAPLPGLLVSTARTLALPAVFTAAGDLSNTPGTASGYWLNRAGLDPTAVAGALATAFGVAGQPVPMAGTVVVGSADGTGVSLRVKDDPLMSWSYSDPLALDATNGVAITQERAVRLSSALLADIGVDVGTDAVDWQVDRYADRIAVTAWQLVDGDRTELGWRIEFGAKDSVLAASGFSATLQEVPGYAVVGAATAVRRSALPTWAAVGPTPRYETSGDAATSTASATATTVTSPSSTARPALRIPMAGIVVTGAELGLAQFWQPDGGLLILPAYLLDGDDGSRWSLIAVASDYVDFVDVPYPTVDPRTG